jgi:hypothetical protein
VSRSGRGRQDQQQNGSSLSISKEAYIRDRNLRFPKDRHTSVIVGDVKTLPRIPLPRNIKEVAKDGIIVQYATAANLLANIGETTQIRASLEAQGPI